MSDQRLRELARAASLGDQDSKEQLRAQRVRSGLCASCAGPLKSLREHWLGRITGLLGYTGLCHSCTSLAFLSATVDVLLKEERKS